MWYRCGIPIFWLRDLTPPLSLRRLLSSSRPGVTSYARREISYFSLSTWHIMNHSPPSGQFLFIFSSDILCIGTNMYRFNIVTDHADAADDLMLVICKDLNFINVFRSVCVCVCLYAWLYQPNLLYIMYKIKRKFYRHHHEELRCLSSL